MADRSNILLAQCTISEYEETMDNFEIFSRFGISLEYLPKFVLFKSGNDVNRENIIYPRSNSQGYFVTGDELKQLLIDENVWLGLQGTLKEFSNLVNDFMSLYENTKREEMIKTRGMTIDEIRNDIGNKGKDIISQFESQSGIAVSTNDVSTNDVSTNNLKSAKYYMKVMAKMVAQGKEYAQKEYDRIEKLLFDENVKQSVKKWFTVRMNILSMFGAQSQREPQYGYDAGYDDMYNDMYNDMHYDL